jgi:predicted dehydrogenase
VLPAAQSLEAITQISVASRRQRAPEVGADIAWFDNYSEALRSSGADVVYVSGVNAAHAEWVSRALEDGLHVIVDKPAFLDVSSAERAVALARRRARLLAEATVFACHPQVVALQSLLDRDDRSSLRVSATFAMPALGAENFRYRADCGGGSLYDLGPYVAAANRLLFGAAPATIACVVLTTTGSPAVDTSFSVLLTHRDGGALTGHFGFVSMYDNHLSVLTRSRDVECERIFTTPPDLACTLRVREDHGERLVMVPPADSFALFLQACVDAVQGNDVDAFEFALLEDARLVQRLREAASV